VLKRKKRKEEDLLTDSVMTKADEADTCCQPRGRLLGFTYESKTRENKEELHTESRWWGWHRWRWWSREGMSVLWRSVVVVILLRLSARKFEKLSLEGLFATLQTQTVHCNRNACVYMSNGRNSVQSALFELNISLQSLGSAHYELAAHIPVVADVAVVAVVVRTKYKQVIDYGDRKSCPLRDSSTNEGKVL